MSYKFIFLILKNIKNLKTVYPPKKSNSKEGMYTLQLVTLDEPKEQGARSRSPKKLFIFYDLFCQKSRRSLTKGSMLLQFGKFKLLD